MAEIDRVSQSKLREMCRKFVKLSLFQGCLRRWFEIATSPVFYGLVFGFIVVGAVIGPYGVRESLGFFDRLIFSFQANAVLWTIAVIVAVPVRLAVQRLHPNRFAAILTSCLCAGLVITPVLDTMLQYQLGTGFVFSDYIEYSILFFILASVIAYILVQLSRIERNILSVAGTASDVPQILEGWTESLLLKRLPHAKRGRVLAMVAQDHYVEIVTDRGAELVLMRLSDAVREVEPEVGLQVHRSAWVSIYGVEKTGRKQRRSFAVLKNGRHIPVARSKETILIEQLQEQPLTMGLPLEQSAASS